MLTKISSSSAPKAIGPYAQAVKAAGFLFISGVMPLNPATNDLVPGGIIGQTEQIMSNLDAVLAEAGYSFADIAKTTCFLSDINDFEAFNRVYSEHFSHCPARSCIAVRGLPKGALAEIEAVACH